MTNRLRGTLSHTLLVFALLMVTRLAPAPIFGSYPGITNLCKQSDAIVVVRITQKLPGENSGMFQTDFYELRVLKNIRGALREQTTFTANLRFLPIIFSEFTKADAPAATKADAPTSGTFSNIDPDQMAQSLISSWRPQKAVGGNWLLFASNNAGLLQGKTESEMHPLNYAQWSNIDYVGSLIRLSDDLDLTTDVSADDFKQVTELVVRQYRLANP